VVLRLLARPDLQRAVNCYGQVDLRLVEAAEVELVDDAALLVVVHGVARDQLGGHVVHAGAALAAHRRFGRRLVRLVVHVVGEGAVGRTAGKVLVLVHHVCARGAVRCGCVRVVLGFTVVARFAVRSCREEKARRLD